MPTNEPSSKEQAKSATPVALSPEEAALQHKMQLLANVKVIRERMATVHGEVRGKKDNKVYVWVNIDDNRQIHYQTYGYELCKDEQVQTNWKRPDGTHRRGDLILYHIDKDLYEAITMDGELRAVEAVEGYSTAFKSTAEVNGVPVYVPR